MVGLESRSGNYTEILISGVHLKIDTTKELVKVTAKMNR
jgi:hypothetical protein